MFIPCPQWWKERGWNIYLLFLPALMYVRLMLPKVIPCRMQIIFTRSSVIWPGDFLFASISSLHLALHMNQIIRILIISHCSSICLLFYRNEHNCKHSVLPISLFDGSIAKFFPPKVYWHAELLADVKKKKGRYIHIL
jgi:hypothetical protein